MKKYQVWLRGSDLCDVEASSEAEARRIIRNFYGYKRLPKGTCVFRIPFDYYNQFVENNKMIGIDGSNLLEEYDAEPDL